MSDYQIAKDGTIFHIKEDGTISKLGKIENDKIVSIPSTSSSSNSGSGKGAMAFFLVAFIIAAIVLGYLLAQSKSDYNYMVSSYTSKISSLNIEISSLEENLTTARSERDAARQELTSFRNVVGRTIPLVISDIEIANTTNEGTIETNYGATLYSNRSMFFKPQIKYMGFSSGNITLYVKLYTPSGIMSTGSSSPPGYSYSSSVYFSSGQNTAQLSGWGSSTKGHWPSGTYRIEIWYNNSCLKSKSFTVY